MDVDRTHSSVPYARLRAMAAPSPRNAQAPSCSDRRGPDTRIFFSTFLGGRHYFGLYIPC